MGPPTPDTDTAVCELAPLLPEGTKIGDRYVVRGIIGSGGCGMIYEAEQVGMGRSVAIKVPHPEYGEGPQLTQRFAREVRIAAQVRHPNILVVHDAGAMADGTPYLVMERLDGVSLEQRLKQGMLPIHTAVDVVSQVLDALDTLARHHIVHRDVKPSNLMLSRTPAGGYTVKLLDFGIARPVEDAEGGLTLTGTLVGTPEYMAPEQLVGARVDARTDIYACGVLLYELLSGKNPHGPRSITALLSRSVANEVPARLTGSGRLRVLDRVLQRALARKPDDRYQSAAAMRAALHEALSRPLRTRWLAPSVGGAAGALCTLLLGAALSGIAVAPHEAAANAGASAAQPIAVVHALPPSAQEPAGPGLRAQAPAEVAAQAVRGEARAGGSLVGESAAHVDARAAARAHTRALRALAVGDFVDAERALDRSLVEYPGHMGALRTRVVVALARGDRDAAELALGRLRAAHPDAPELSALTAQLTR